MRNETFVGDFDTLPLAAHIAVGPVPEYPTSDDFQRASMRADDSPAHRWFCEAVRQRRLFPGQLLDDGMSDINARVANALYELARNTA